MLHLQLVRTMCLVFCSVTRQAYLISKMESSTSVETPHFSFYLRMNYKIFMLENVAINRNMTDELTLWLEQN